MLLVSLGSGEFKSLSTSAGNSPRFFQHLGTKDIPWIIVSFLGSSIVGQITYSVLLRKGLIWSSRGYSFIRLIAAYPGVALFKNKEQINQA